MKVTVEGYTKEGHYGTFTTDDKATAETLIELFFERWWYAADPSVNMAQVTQTLMQHGSVTACISPEANIARAV